MKTKTLIALCIVATLAIGSQVRAQDSTKVNTQTDSQSQMKQKTPRMMQTMDSDKNGMISREEAKAAKNQKLFENFDEADASGDGMIDATEFMASSKMGIEKGASANKQGSMSTMDTLSTMDKNSTEIMNPVDDVNKKMDDMGDAHKNMNSMNDIDNDMEPIDEADDTMDSMDGNDKNMDDMKNASGTMGTMKNMDDQQLRKDFIMADTSGDGMIDMAEFIAFEKKTDNGGMMKDENMGNMKMKDSTNN